MSKKAKSTKKYPMSDKEYAKHGGKCPFCGSENIEGQCEDGIDDSGYWQQVICLDCLKRWNDIYTLTSYADTLTSYAELDNMGHEITTKGKDTDAKG